MIKNKIDIENHRYTINYRKKLLTDIDINVTTTKKAVFLAMRNVPIAN